MKIAFLGTGLMGSGYGDGRTPRHTSPARERWESPSVSPQAAGTLP